MTTERDVFGKCVRCGDTAVTRTGACFYCNWKGLTGPGAELKKIIKEENQKKNEIIQTNG